MHYYKRNIGDYHKKAGRLSLLQHGVYTILMDAIYDREKFPTREEAIDWCWASTAEEIEAVEFVLRKFFENEGGYFTQKRIKEEIDSYSEFCEMQSEKGKKGGRPKANGLNKKPGGFKNKAEQSRNKAKQSLTTNQEPLTTNHIDKPPNGGCENSVSTRTPHSEIISLWNVFAEKHGLPQVVKQTGVIESQLRQRWKDDLGSLEQWNNYFDFISQSKFLMGKTEPLNGRQPFRATLQWITKESNFAKIAAREYH